MMMDLAVVVTLRDTEEEAVVAKGMNVCVV